MPTTRDEHYAELIVDKLMVESSDFDRQRAARILAEYREEILKPFEGAALFLRPGARTDRVGDKGVAQMKKITEQGIFNFVYRFIVKQGKAAMDRPGLFCQYRAKDERGQTTACAAGCLITDEEARQLGPGSWRSQEDINIPERFLPFTELIQELQAAHDEPTKRGLYSGPGYVFAFKSRMAVVACKYGLTVPTDV